MKTKRLKKLAKRKKHLARLVEGTPKKEWNKIKANYEAQNK